jgi:hypothetical protein
MSDSDLHDLCLRYLDGSLNEEELQAFNRLIAESEEAAQHLARYAIHDHLFQAALRAYKNKSSDQHRTDRLLAELLRMEQGAPLNLVDPVKPKEPRKRPSESSAPSLRQAAGLLGWALMHSLRSKPVAWVSAAAAVLLLIAVTVVWQSAGPVATQETPGPLAGQTDQPRYVATLSGVSDAKWEQGEIATGSALYPGDRFALAEGFAEITTNRGAIAIIQAPATIELGDSDNAIELHSGKLLGICETESSKGFVVRTPHMVVTDLGTRFGVDATSTASEVHVIEGEVEAAGLQATDDAEPIRLAAGASARKLAGSDSLIAIESDIKRFSALLPKMIQLPGTGVGLNIRETDPNWQVIAIDGRLLDTPLALAMNGGQHYVMSHPNDPEVSQWLSFKPTEQSGDEHTYRVRTTLDLPQKLSSEHARIKLSYMADNALRAVIVNGQRVELSQKEWLEGFDAFEHAVIDQHLLPGKNLFEFELVNISKGGKLSIAGLRVAWELETQTRLNDGGIEP